MNLWLPIAVMTAVLVWPGRCRQVGGLSRAEPARAARSRERPPRHTTPYAVADALVLLSLAIRAGFPPVEALEEVAGRLDGAVAAQLRSVAAAHRWGLEPAECWAVVPEVWRPAAVAWEAALTAGVSPAALVERSAAVIRDRETQRVEVAVARAGVLLVLPLGLAFLPGFVATTVVPVVLHLLLGFRASGIGP